jgi:ribosomal protein L11 methyltransferase
VDSILYFYKMNYVEIEFFDTEPEKKEILIALLAEIGFDTFLESEDGMSAYIPEDAFNKNILEEEVLEKFQSISYTVSTIAQQNWNETWEKNFEPMQIGDVYVRAPFHEKRDDVKYELIIEPKMSFGTGHHATTSLMVLEMLKTDFREKSVLDMGCGTSLLAILASKLGAKNILAIDIDDWAVENSKENCLRNNTPEIVVKKGDASLLIGKSFDIILANINRNVLLADMNQYSQSLNQGGEILFSGFYESDIDAIKEAAAKEGLEYKAYDVLREWAVLRFKK